MILVLALLALPFQVFAADAIFEHDKNYEVKGWSVFSADDDIDTTAQMITELDTTYAQLAAEDEIEVLSSSTSDITQTVTIKGIDSNGNQVEEDVALSTLGDGTTVTTSDTIFRYIDQASLDVPTVGTVTIRRETGDTFIISIPPAILEAGIVQHFNGEKVSYLYGWDASVTSTTGTVTYDLRWYPDDSKCLSPTTGMVTLDTIALTNALGTESHELPNIRLPKGGWLTVYATGGSANADGTVRIYGFDSAN
jgi:hypothetical protein